MVRLMAVLVAVGALLAGATGCGGSDDDAVAPTGSEADGSADRSAGSGDGPSSGDTGVDGFCERVDELVTATEGLADDPTDTDLRTRVAGLGPELADQATDIAAGADELSDGDAEQFEECQADLVEVYSG